MKPIYSYAIDNTNNLFEEDENHSSILLIAEEQAHPGIVNSEQSAEPPVVKGGERAFLSKFLNEYSLLDEDFYRTKKQPYG